MHVLFSVALAGIDPIVLPVEQTDEVISLRAPDDWEFDDRVVGGVLVPRGEWDDAVGVVMDGQYVGCTGTLVASNVVITAAHCAGSITHVIVGTKDWFSNQGEVLEVQNTFVHPSYNGSGGYDIAVLKLRGESSYPPRIIGNDCIIDDELFDGASVTITGFGNTQVNGEGSTSRLRTVDSIVRDADCSQNRIDGMLTGCVPEIRPGGEVAAGGRLDYDGDGTLENADACFGDSGGPLYLNTTRGAFVIGATSRSFLGVSQSAPCRDGGIWVRPDAVMRFIESNTNVVMARPQCNDAPIATVLPIIAKPGEVVTATVEVDDPEQQAFTVEVLGEATLGTLTVDGSGLVFTAFDGVEGDEVVTIAVTDGGHPLYEGSPPITVEVPVEISVRRGPACGCSAGSGPVVPLGMLVGLVGMFWRRRR